MKKYFFLEHFHHEMTDHENTSTVTSRWLGKYLRNIRCLSSGETFGPKHNVQCTD